MVRTAIIVGVFVLAACGDNDAKRARQANGQRQVVMKRSAPISPDIYVPYQRDGYPKTFETWGRKGIERVQRLRESAAKAVSKNPRCDAVEMSELSDARSSPPNNPVVFVDCRNSERFYLSEADVDSAVTSEMDKGKQFDSAELIERCTREVRLRLSVPASLDQDFFSSRERQGTSGNRVVAFNFKAKNRLGIALPASAECIMTTQGSFEVNISERP